MTTARTWLFNLVAACAALCATGATWTDSNTGLKWTYSISGGKATVGGGSSTTTAILSSVVGSVAIPDTLGGCPVTKIAPYAFYNCSKLTDVTIPATVTSIGSRAFQDCAKLNDLSIPNGVTSIGSYAFCKCKSFVNAVLPSELTSIEGGILSSCDLLQQVSIGGKVSSIGHYPFSSCPKLVTISIDENNQHFKVSNGVLLTKDGTKLMQGINGVVVVPDGVTTIAYGSFTGLSGLTEITMPDGVERIEMYAFDGCTGMKKIAIPASMTNVAYNAFSNSRSVTDATLPGWACNLPLVAIENLTISPGTTVVKNGGFRSTTVRHVTLPASVTSIGSEAFSGCSSMTDISLPDGLTSIGARAFSGCQGLVALSIPNSVTDIGSSAFGNCMLLTELTIPSGVKEINSSVFSGCKGLVRLDIPQGVTNIGSSAFYNCESLTEVTIPEGVAAIGECAFYGCSALGSIRMPQKVTEVGNRMLGGCSSMTNVTLPSSMASVPVAFFDGCSALSDIVLPEDVVNIGGSAFAGCAISSVKIPAGVTNISSGAFANCRKLERLDLPDGMDNVADRLCYNCTALAACTIPNGVTNIGAYAFYNCETLSEVSIPRQVRTIGERAFSGCDALTKITIPDSVTYLGNLAIHGPALDFEGRPPEGLFASFYPSGAAVRYNEAYAVEWAIALSAYSKTEGAEEVAATPYAPENWVSPEVPYEGTFEISFDAQLQNGHVRLAWQSRGVAPSTPVAFDIVGWREGSDPNAAVTLAEDVPTPFADYALDGRSVAWGTSCRLFAVRYRFADGSECLSSPVDLRAVIPSRIGIGTTGGLSQGIVGLNWHVCSYYEDPNGGEAMVEADLPQGWPWNGYSYGQAELCATRSAGSVDMAPVDSWEVLSGLYASDANRLEYALNAYDVTMHNSYDLFVIRYQFGYGDDGLPCYVYSSLTDLRDVLPLSIAIETTGTVTNGVVMLSWNAKAQYATGEGPAPEGWPWDQGWPQIGGVRRGNDAEYVDYDWSYAGTYPEVLWSSNGCGTAKIVLDSARVAMGDVYDRFAVRFSLYSYDPYYGGQENVIASSCVDLSGAFPGCIRPVATGAVLEGDILKITWRPKAYVSWEEGAAECALPEGWPWCTDYSAQVYGQVRSEYAPYSGEWTLMGDDWQKSGTGEVRQNAYGIATGTSPVQYRMQLSFPSSSYPYSEYGTLLPGPALDVSNVLPGCIRVEAKGELKDGFVNLSCEPHAYVSTQEGAAECTLPEGWPWGQAMTMRVCGLRADGPNAEAYYGMPIEGYDYLMGDMSSISIPLSAYAVAMGTANNVYELQYEMMSDPYLSYYSGLCILTSTRADLRGQIPGSIRVEATGSLDNGVVTIDWKPHAYVSADVGAQECALPDGWPWGQETITLCGEHADRQTSDPYCSMPVYGYEHVYTTDGQGQVQFMLNAYDVSRGYANNVYRLRYELRSWPYYSSYEETGYLESSLVDLRGQIPGSIRVEATGSLDNGVVTIDWKPCAYVSADAGAQECALPAGWPWGQETITLCGEHADLQSSDPYCSMPVYGYEHVYTTDGQGQVQFMLNAYDVSRGYANNVYRLRYELRSWPYYSSYEETGYLESSLVDLRGQIPGSIRVEATGSLDNGVVTIAWKPHAYVSADAGAQECVLPAGWPWGQETITLCGEHADFQSSDPYCGMPVHGYEHVYTTDGQGQVQFMLNAYEVARGYANNVYRLRYELRSWPYYSSYEETGYLESSLVDLRGQIPGCIRVEATGRVRDDGNVELSWTPRAYESAAEGAAACAMPGGWPWGQGQVSILGARVEDMPSADSFWGMPIDGNAHVSDNSCSIPLNGYDVAMGYAYNAYQVRYDIWPTDPSYGMGGTVNSNPIDLRSHIPGCVRLNVTGELVNGEVRLGWSAKAYASMSAGASECTLPAGWPWTSANVELCGYRAWDDCPPPPEGWYAIGFGTGLPGAKSLPLDAGDVVAGLAYNMYTVRMALWPSSSCDGNSGYLVGDAVDLRDQIPHSVGLNATAFASNGTARADWSLVAYYGNTQDPAGAGTLPDGWPWGSSWGIHLAVGSELARTSLTNTADMISGALLDPQQSWLTLEIRREDGLGCLYWSQELPMAGLIVSSAYGTTSPYTDATRLVRGAALSISVDTDVYETEDERQVLTGWELEGATTQSGTGKVCDFVLAGDTTLTWIWRKEGEDAEPTVEGDPGATVTGDAVSGYTIVPSTGTKEVEVTIPEDVAPEMVTVEVGTDVTTIKPNGANVKIVKGGNDITSYLDIPAADANGTVDLTKAAVKDEIVKETLDPEKGAEIQLDAESPTLTTSETKPGLTYTLKEGVGIENMTQGDSKVGDGQPWTPNITVKGGSSGFYSIEVTK